MTPDVPERVLHPLPGFAEPFSAISHLTAAGVFLVLGVLLLRRGRGSAARVALLGVFAVSCVLLLSISGVFHMTTRGGTARGVMQRLDHGAIFVLIAGTFTPIHGLLFSGRLRWAPLLFIWAAAAGGIVAKTGFYDYVPEWVGLTLYLAMGWFGVFSGGILGHRRGFAYIRPLLFGGLAYSVGAIVDFLRWPVIIPGVFQWHELFHVAVIGGVALHWHFVWKIADAASPVVDAESPPLIDR